MNKNLMKRLKKCKLILVLLFPIIYIRRALAKQIQKNNIRFYEMAGDYVKSGSLVVNLFEFEGLFEMGFRSSILRRILVYHDYESEIVELIRKLIDPSKDAIDVGANIGLYTILFSKLIDSNHKVLSIEPTLNALSYLKKNITLNNCTHNVVIYDGIAINSEGLFNLNVIDGLEEYSSIAKLDHPFVKNMKYSTIEVKGNTIDNLVIEHNLKPGIIKIDVEGAEYIVLQGAHKTITKYKPIIISELSEKLLTKQGYSCMQMIKMFDSIGYRILSPQTMKPLSRATEGYFLALPKIIH
jgi:FkbM family methyltransferase